MLYSIMKQFTIYQDDDGQWVAECEELPGYRATGRTSEEAIEKMKSALLRFYPCRCED
jgi:predicted RNase H-like HicB family nuclease